MKGLSVIMPVYNEAGCVSVMIDSIMAQDYADFELIIIDDGSTDGTVQVLEKYAARDGRIRLVVQEENKGVSAARNLGLEFAEGKYVAFVDADDRIHPSMYRSLIHVLEKYGCDIAMCRIFYEYGNTGEGREEVLPYMSQGILGEKVCREVIGRIISNNQDFFAGIVRYVFKKEILRNSRFDTGIAYREDLLFLFDLLVSRKEIYYVDFVGYYYVRTQTSAVERYRESLFDDLMYVNNRLFSLLEKRENLEDYDRLYAMKVLQAVSLSISNLYRKDAPRRTTVDYFRQIRKFRQELEVLKELKIDNSAVKYRPLLLLVKIRADWAIHMIYSWKEKKRQRKYKKVTGSK